MMNRRVLRFVTLCLALWLPAHSVVAGVLHEVLHAHEAHATAEHHHHHEADADAQDDGENSDCSSAHALCHLALSPGLIGTVVLASGDGVHCFHPAATHVFGTRPPDRIIRPPLAQA